MKMDETALQHGLNEESQRVTTAKRAYLIVTLSAACWKSCAHWAKCSKNFSNVGFDKLMVRVLRSYRDRG